MKNVLRQIHDAKVILIEIVLLLVFIRDLARLV